MVLTCVVATPVGAGPGLAHAHPGADAVVTGRVVLRTVAGRVVEAVAVGTTLPVELDLDSVVAVGVHEGSSNPTTRAVCAPWTWGRVKTMSPRSLRQPAARTGEPGAHEWAAMWCTGKARRRCGLMPARRGNGASVTQRGSLGCARLSFAG